MKCYKNRAFIKNKSVISNNSNSSNKVLFMQWNSFLELSKMAAREKEFCQFISNSLSLSLSLSLSRNIQFKEIRGEPFKDSFKMLLQKWEKYTRVKLSQWDGLFSLY